MQRVVVPSLASVADRTGARQFAARRTLLSTMAPFNFGGSNEGGDPVAFSQGAVPRRTDGGSRARAVEPSRGTEELPPADTSRFTNLAANIAFEVPLCVREGHSLGADPVLNRGRRNP